MRVVLFAVALAIAGLGAGSASAQPAKTAKTSAGEALVDSKGMTLYTFDKDVKGKSNCSGRCAANWPPFAASGSAEASGDWTIVEREDGSAQWAYKGKPLYTWVNDKAPGDAGGGKIPSWQVAEP